MAIAQYIAIVTTNIKKQRSSEDFTNANLASWLLHWETGQGLTIPFHSQDNT